MKREAPLYAHPDARTVQRSERFAPAHGLRPGICFAGVWVTRRSERTVRRRVAFRK
jgi:hypothetical protein